MRIPERSQRWLAVELLAVLLLVYLFAGWPWMQHWGTTPDERTRALPGDALVVAPTDQSTRAVTVRVPADEAWRWLVQIGEDRAGFYSYAWLENLFGARIRNADRVHPEWQTLRVGDLVRAVPDGYLGGALDTPGWRVALVEPGRAFVLRGWGSFVVAPVDARTSRVLVRTRYRDTTWWGPLVSRLAFGPVHFVMERRMLLGLRDRAEGRSTPPVLAALAATGFVTGVAGTLVLLLRRPHGARWVAAPALLAAAVLAGTGDPLAAAAGFTALGLTLLGLRGLGVWWPVRLPVAAAVLLVLLLAPDAYVAFGLAFAAVALAVLVAWVARAPAPRARRPTPRMRPSGVP